VFVLDMGEPVRIQDLAYRMINLMGLTVQDEEHPDGDIAIDYIGLRPAEKLYEELLIGSNASGTRHPRILRADEEFLPFQSVALLIEKLKVASTTLDFEGARNLLMHAVKEYNPSNDVDDLIWLSVDSSGTNKAQLHTVVQFPDKLA